MKFLNIWILADNKIFRMKSVSCDVVKETMHNCIGCSSVTIKMILNVCGFDAKENLTYEVLTINLCGYATFDEVYKICRNVSTELFSRFLRYIDIKYENDDIVDIEEAMKEIVSPRFIKYAINKVKRELNGKSVEIVSPLLNSTENVS